MALLKVEGLRININNRCIVDDLSLSLHAGNVYCLLGPNGAGKTTALRGIVGAIPIQNGAIHVGECSMNTHPTDAKQHLGFIPDDGWLFRNVTAQQYLMFIGKLRRMTTGQARSATQKLAAKFKVGDALEQSIDELSRGTQQKIAMIAGLMHRPNLVVMDEPLTALDPLVAREATNLIKQLRDEGVAFLIATHLLSFAESVATHIGLLFNGQLVYQGSITEVKQYYAQNDLETVLAYASENFPQ